MLGFSKALRARAKAADMGLFLAVHAHPVRGSNEFAGAMRHDLAASLWHFAFRIYRGDTPAEAFAAAQFPDRRNTFEDGRTMDQRTLGTEYPAPAADRSDP